MMNLTLPQDHGKPWNSMKKLAPAAGVQYPGGTPAGGRLQTNNESHQRHERAASFNR
jgi:hypothetical protein